MARLIARATGLLMAAASWGVVDNTSLLDSEAANTALGTGYAASSTFTPGAITTDGIAVKLASRNAAPSGTITVALDQAGSDVAGTVVTINVADLPACSTAQNEGGWVFFKFAAPVALAAATAYSVKARTSVAGQVNLYRNATANNWSRMLRTTTTAVPAAGDILIGIGEKTGAGTSNSFTHTMDNTADITFGTACDTGAPLAIVTGAYSVGNGYTLNGGTAVATNYLLKMAGCFICYSGSTVDLWRAATLPTDSTGTITFVPAASGDFGFVYRNGSTYSLGPIADPQGRTSRGALLAVTAAAAAVALTLDGAYNWLNTDPIMIGATGSYPNTAGVLGHDELRTLSANQVGTGITISAGLTNAHLGEPSNILNDPDTGVSYDCPRMAQVMNLSGQITVNTNNSAIGWFMFAANTAIVAIEWSLLRYLGSTLVGRRGVEVDTTTGSFLLRNFAVRDAVSTAMVLGSSSPAWNNVTVTKMVAFNISTAVQADCFIIQPTSAKNWTVDDWMIAKTGKDGNTSVQIKALGGSVFKTKRMRISTHQGYNYPYQISTGGANSNRDASFGIIELNSSWCFGGGYINNTYEGVISYDRLYTWRNQAGPFFASSNGLIGEVVSWGDAGFAFGFPGGGRCDIDKMLLAGDEISAAAQGFWFDDFTNSGRVKNCVISPNSGNFKPLQSAITLMFPQPTAIEYTFENASIAKGGGRFLNAPNFLDGRSYIAFEKLVGATTAGTNPVGFSQFAMVGGGNIGRDTAILRNAEPTMRITQENANKKVFHAPLGKGILVPTKRVSGNLVAQAGTIDLRMSVIGDGAAYNGNAPELWVRANPALGIAVDTLLATMVGASGVWNTTAFNLPIPTNDGAYELVATAGGVAAPTGWVNVANLTVA